MINVRIGQLRQVVPETLVYCWGVVSARTPLEGSQIAVETVPARLRCRACGSEADVGDTPAFGCAGCGGSDTEMISGEEFLITSLDLAAPAAAEAPEEATT